jgi:cyanophycinase
MGTILLACGAEFDGQMAAADRRAIELAGGPDAPIRIVPAAAAPDNNHRRAGENGVDWFRSLGATNVSALPLIDAPSASHPAVVDALSQAGLIYLLGGFPRHLAHSLQGSRGWQAMLAAYRAGAVIAGSSAGAMVLCEHFYDPGSSRLVPGLDLIKDLCILPHHDTFGRTWAARLHKLLPHTVLLGIDEETGLICRPSAGRGQVHGKGRVTLYRNGQIDAFGPEREFDLKRLNASNLP